MMNVFDILGPVMIGPSSSHTAGAVRIGYIARILLGSAPIRAEIGLHGSFAKTYKGHGTDKALIAGILGMKTDNPLIRKAPELAKEQGISIHISEVDIEGAHPNTASILLENHAGKVITLIGSSIGGGNIHITQVNNMDVLITGESTTLVILHQDVPGMIAAVTETVAEEDINISNFRLSRKERGGQAVMTIELDHQVDEALNQKIKNLPNILNSILLQPI